MRLSRSVWRTLARYACLIATLPLLTAFAYVSPSREVDTSPRAMRIILRYTYFNDGALETRSRADLGRLSREQKAAIDQALRVCGRMTRTAWPRCDQALRTAFAASCQPRRRPACNVITSMGVANEYVTLRRTDATLLRQMTIRHDSLAAKVRAAMAAP